MPADPVWTLDGDETSWGGWALARTDATASSLVRELIGAHPAHALSWALDVGSGTGSAFGPLAAAGYRVVGVDPTLQAAAAARARIARDGLPAWSVLASAARLPFADGTMAFLLAMGTLYHLSAPELVAALEEVWRVLQPGGQVVLHFLDVDDWRSTLAPSIAAEQAPMPSYQAVVTCFASQQTVRHWLDTAGLQVLSLELRTKVSEAGEMRNWIATCRRTDKESS